MLKNKKGIALNQAFAAVLVLVLVAVLVIVGLFMFSTLRGTFPLSSHSTVQETFTTVNELNTTTANSSLCRFTSFAVTEVRNSTAGGAVIPADNYTVDSALGSIIYSGAAGDSGGFNNSDWIINHTFQYGGDGCTATDATIAQFATYPALIGLVGTIIFLGLVIGVLMASFVFGGRGSGV